MKNIQIIDGADNCTYSIFAVTNEEFAVLFPATGQDIEFIEDVLDRLGVDKLVVLMQPVWERPKKSRGERHTRNVVLSVVEQEKNVTPPER